MPILTQQRIDEILASMGADYTVPGHVSARMAWVRYAFTQTDTYRGKVMPLWLSDDLSIGLVCVNATINGIMFANIELYNENQRLKHGDQAVLLPNIFLPPQKFADEVRQAGLRASEIRERQRIARETRRIEEMEAAKAAAPPADPPPPPAVRAERNPADDA